LFVGISTRKKNKTERNFAACKALSAMMEFPVIFFSDGCFFQQSKKKRINVYLAAIQGLTMLSAA
jgi:hypothetical protein